MVCTWIPGEVALLLGGRRERVGGDAGLVAGGGGEVGHVLVGGHLQLLLLLNRCQILEHHLPDRYEIFFLLDALSLSRLLPRTLVCGWMKQMTDGSASARAHAGAGAGAAGSDLTGGRADHACAAVVVLAAAPRSASSACPAPAAVGTAPRYASHPP